MVDILCVKTADDYFAHLQSVDKSKWNGLGMYPGLSVCLSTDYKATDEFLSQHELFSGRGEMPAPAPYCKPYIGFLYEPGTASVELINGTYAKEELTEEFQNMSDQLGGLGSSIVVNQYGRREFRIGQPDWYQRFYDVTKLIVDFAKERGDRVALPAVKNEKGMLVD